MQLSVVLLPGAIPRLRTSLEALVAQSGLQRLTQVVVPTTLAAEVAHLAGVPARVVDVSEDTTAPWRRASRGDWVAFMHAGDVWEPGRLEALARLEDDEPGMDAIYGDVLLGGAVATPRRFSELMDVPTPETLPERILRDDCVPAPSLVVRRSAAARVEGRVGMAWDVHLCVGLISLGARFVRFDDHAVHAQMPGADTRPEALEYHVDVVRAFRRLGDHPEAQRRAVRDVEILSRRRDTEVTDRLSSFRLREIVSGKTSRRMQLMAAMVPAALDRVEPSLKYSKPFRNRILSQLAVQPLHDCSHRPDSLCHQQPGVTIVIPCYNYGAFVGEAITSALAQSHPRVSVIVIDDGSTDDSAEVAESFGDKITFISQTNRGVARTRNRAAEMVTTPFLMFLDADDRLHPCAVQELLGRFCDSGNDPQLGFVYGQQRMFGRIERMTAFPPFDPKALVRGNYVGAEAMLRRDVFMVARYDPDLSAWEDWDFYLTLTELGYGGRMLDMPIVDYRVHTDRPSRGDSLSSARDQAELAKVIWDRHRPLVTRTNRGKALVKRAVLGAIPDS